jgi:GNAT superfamily N-acetyltransferase
MAGVKNHHKALRRNFCQKLAELFGPDGLGSGTRGTALGGGVAGFYSLAVGSVTPESAPQRVAQVLARHPVPVMILARLAVDQAHQGRGLGQALLRDALLRTAQAADIAGIRALLVHAKDDVARKGYESWNFEPSPSDPLHLFLMLKDLKALL